MLGVRLLSVGRSMLSVHMFLIIKFYFNENQKQIMLRLFSLIGILFLLLLISTGAGLCAGEAADTSTGILVRTEVRPKENIVVGQRVILQVDVLAPDGWAQIKGVRDFSVEGTQVVRYESQGTRLNETIQGRSFTGQRYELSLFPRRDGKVTVPSIPVEVEVSRWGSKDSIQSERVQTPEVTFQVRVPPGAEGVQGLISAPGLTATQKWEPEQQKFKVGEAIKRTIELSGRDISGMAFTPLRFKSTEMVSAYPAEPRVDDSFDRGTLSGKRIETVTYVFAGEGTVELPKIVIPWWDIDKKKLRQAILPALKLEIIPSPMAAKGKTGSGTAQGQTRSLPRWLVIALIALAALLVLAAFYHRRILSWWTRWQQARREQEDFYFKQFAKMAHSNDPKVAFNNLMHWLDRIHPGPGAARLDEFLQRYGDKKSLVEADRLEQALSKGSTGWSGKPLVEAMNTARQNWRKTQQTGEAVMSLPPLNP